MERGEAKRVIEALLFVSEKPLTDETLSEVLEDIKPSEIKNLTDELNSEYGTNGRTFMIKEIGGGFQMMTDPIYSKWISQLYKRPSEKLRGPALETLSIIAYKQPITRSEIEAIRGVNIDSVLANLEEKELVLEAYGPEDLD